VSDKAKKYIFTTLKASVSAGLILFLIYQMDLAEFLSALRNFPLWGFLLVVIIFCLTILVGALRWSIFIQPFGKVSYIKLMGLYFVGYFFNNFLPSGVGGDVVRGYIAGRELNNISAGYSSIVAERVAGILATVLLALLALPFIQYKSQIATAVIALNLGLWLAILLFFILPSENIIRKLFSWLPTTIGEKLFNFVEMLMGYRKHFPTLIIGFIYSLLYQSSIILTVVITGYFAGAKLPLQFYFATVPLVWIISLIPISLNALGVREASFAYFFQLFGSSRSVGFLVSIIFLASALIAGLFGGIIFAFWNSSRKKIPNETMSKKN